MHQSVWLLVWDSEHGDEGEGHEYIGVFDEETNAVHAANTWERPAGFQTQGGYSVYRLRRNPTGPKKEERSDEADWEAERLADFGPLPSFLQEPARAWERELREKGILD